MIESTLSDRNCPVCTANSFRVLFSKKGFCYVRCNICDMIYINPIPTTPAINQVYEEYGESYFKRPEKIEIDFTAVRFEKEMRFLHHNLRSGRLLDVGCSTGSFLLAAAQAGFIDPVGVDISRPAVEYAKGRGLNACAGNFSGSLFAEESFDVLTMWATLEHLPDPGRFVREAYRVLKPGGFLAVSVPNMDSFTQVILGKRDRYVGSDHLNYFSCLTMSRLLKTDGFTDVRMETRSINPIVILGDLLSIKININKQIVDSQRTSAIKSHRSFAPFRFVYRVVDHILFRMGRGDLLLASARKPLQ